MPEVFLTIVVLLGGIAPHVFQLIKTAVFRQHDVDYDAHIIDQYPLKGLPAFVLIGKFIAIFHHPSFYRIGYRFDLRGATRLTNDKKVRYCFWYFS